MRTGVSHVHGGKDYIHLREILLPEVMKANGYATGMWGKWHSGVTNGYLPRDRGFDEAYKARLYKHENTEGLYNGKSVAHQGWADSIAVDYAIDFIRRNQEVGTPYFAFLPFLAPHGPIRAPEQSVEHFRQQGLSENFATLAGMIHHLDRQVGRLMEYLAQQNQLENTMVIFLSDNGPQFMHGFLSEEEDQLRNQTPHQGHKGNIWELGVKSPLFVSAPWLKPHQDSTLVTVQDLYPTLVELAGGKFPENQLPLDGLSLIPLLLGEDAAAFGQRTVVNFASPGWGPTKEIPYTAEGREGEYDPIDRDSLQVDAQIISIYRSEHKFIMNAQKRDDQAEPPPYLQLFNYVKDPAEHSNLTNEQLNLTKEMEDMATNWIEEMKQESHSFASPVFKIRRSLLENVIKANAPVAKSPSLKNTVTDLRNWQQAGDFAVYRLDVEGSGEYELYLPEDGFLSGQKAKLAISTDLSTHPPLTTEYKGGFLGAIHLQEGPQQLKLELLELDKSQVPDAVSEISTLILKPRINTP